MNTPVSYKMALLLNNKGFKEETLQAYIHRFAEHKLESYEGRLTRDILICDIPAPTIADAVMWLYEKHGVWIAVTQELGHDITFCYQVMGEHISSTYKPDFTSPTEAYEAAIKYTLENIIK